MPRYLIKPISPPGGKLQRPPDLRAEVARARQHTAHPRPLQPLDALDGPRHRRRDRRGPRL